MICWLYICVRTCHWVQFSFRCCDIFPSLSLLLMFYFKYYRTFLFYTEPGSSIWIIYFVPFLVVFFLKYVCVCFVSSVQMFFNVFTEVWWSRYIKTVIQTFKAPGMPVLWGPHNWAYVAGYLFNVPGLQPLKHAWMQHCLWIHDLNAAKFSCHFTGNNFFNMICNWETTKMLTPFFFMLQTHVSFKMIILW